MKVNPANSNQLQGNDGVRDKKVDRTEESSEAKKAKSISSGAEAASRPEISARAREFAQAREIAENTPDVREDRIAALKKKIADGKYKVDTDSVADRMLDDHLRTAGLK